MLLAYAVGLLSLNQAQTVELYRGAHLPSGGYWAVTDTYLDSAAADKSFGGLFTLEGGKGKAILIQFGDLERILPVGARVTKASLYLSPSSSDRPEFAGISAVKSPWGEGPMFVASLGRNAEPLPVRMAATWKQRRNGSIDWQQSGATGPEDAVPIAGASLEQLEKEVAIHGLETTVQAMADRWYENHGFAVTFTGKCEFFSSQAKNGKPRLHVEYQIAGATKGPDLSVQWLTRVGSGEEAEYQAVVKNVGDAPAPAFSARWTVNERTGSTFGVGKGLAPGEESTIQFKKAHRPNDADHRYQTLMLHVLPGQPEANMNNNALSISEDAIPVGFTGAKVSADALQATARWINNVVFTHSRFSFAPEGALERIRLVPSQDQAEIVIDLTGAPSDRKVAGIIVSQLTGLGPVVESQMVEREGQRIYFSDPFPGLNGFGDTRFEGLVPPGIPMLYAPVASPLFDNLTVEPTDLLSSTEVASINVAIGKKGAIRHGILWDLPATVILRATDMTGRPLDGAELSFFQLDGDKIPDLPTQTILTREGGTVILESRDPGPQSTDGIHQLKKNLFGPLRADGSNGTILVKAQINGETEWAWLKAWQLADSYHRGNVPAAMIDIRINAPSGPLDRTSNLAKGRLLSDKAGSLPARLAAFVDEDPTTIGTLGATPGDWLEIDLGRDRPIGEVVIFPNGDEMPAKFDIQAYATGQTPSENDAWIKDLNFSWTRPNRQKSDGSISYRGPMTRARFIRFVNRSGGKGSISEIRVHPLRAEQ
jgi:hypothetical protein